MPFELRGAEALSVRVWVRFGEKDRQQLRDEAQLAGLTVSELIRRRALGRKVISSADWTTINELRRLGGLLKHVHVTSGGGYSKETAGAIADLRQFLQKLTAGQQP